MIMRIWRWLEEEFDEMNIKMSEDFDDYEYDHFVMNYLYDTASDEELLKTGNIRNLFHLTEMSLEIYLFYF